jgi:hypothetical protein
MDLDMTGVYHQPLKIWLTDQFFQQFFPNTLVTPATKAAMRIFPIPIIWRQIAPWSTCAQNPENSIDEKPVITGISAPCPFAAKQMGFQQFPNPIRNIMAMISSLHRELLVCKESIKNLETYQPIDDTI